MNIEYRGLDIGYRRRHKAQNEGQVVWFPEGPVGSWIDGG